MPPEPKSKLGIAIGTLSKRPVHGLRQPPNEDANGWYIWCGEYSESDDFFEPIHVEHVSEYLPQVEGYLSLPPGFRFLVDDDNNYADVWFDRTLVES